MKAKIKGVYVNIPEEKDLDSSYHKTYQGQWNVSRRKKERKYVCGRQNIMGVRYYDYLTMDSRVLKLIRDKIFNSGIDIDIIGNELGYDGFTLIKFLMFGDFKSIYISHAAFIRLLEICGYRLEIKIESSGDGELHKYLHDERLQEMIRHEKNKILFTNQELE